MRLAELLAAVLDYKLRMIVIFLGPWALGMLLVFQFRCFKGR